MDNVAPSTTRKMNHFSLLRRNTYTLITTRSQTICARCLSERFYNSQNENDINEDEKNARGMKCLVLVCT